MKLCNAVLLILCALGSAFLAPPEAQAQTLAFPGAVGFGANAKGGRGGAVLYVNNLNDAGPGSLREALQASGPRTVIFRVGGTITLHSPITVTSPFLTVAGQTAPGDGIAVRHDGVSQNFPKALIEVKTNDVIIRYLRLRRGPGSNNECCGDNIELQGASNVILDHLSMSWSTDENMSMWPATDVTVQWCLIAEGLKFSTHLNTTQQSFGSYAGNTTKNVTYFSNLFATNVDRNPSQAPYDGGDFQLINNVIYNSCRAIVYDQRGSNLTRMDAIGNTILLGPGSCNDARQNIIYQRVKVPKFNLNADGPRSVYVLDNITPNRSAGQPESWATSDGAFGSVPAPVTSLDSFASQPHSGMPSVPALPSGQAKTLVFANAGATLPARDPVDLRILAYSQSNSGPNFVNDPSEVGGWPFMASGTPYADQDGDGMSDSWESSNGFNPSDPSDRNGDPDGDGYTNLEEFLNGTSPGSGGGGGGGGAEFIKNVASGLYLRPANANDDARIQVATKVDNDWFKWEKVPNGSFYHLKNVQTGKYFRPENGNDGSLMQQKPSSWTGTWTQYSETLSSDGVSFHIKNRESGKYLRVVSGTENANVDLRPTSWSGDWTRYEFESASGGGGGGGGSNLVVNPGFESGLSNWTVWNGNAFIDTGTKHSGSQGVRLGAANGGCGSDNIPVTAGSQYSFSAWARTLDSNGNGVVGVSWLNASGTKISEDNIAIATTSWTQLSGTFTAPSGAVNAYVFTWKPSGGDNFNIYVDDFSLVKQ